MNIKMFFHNSILVSLSMVIAYYSMFGPQGIVNYCALRQQLEQDKKSISMLNKNISLLKIAINRHHADDFELEKVARYDLCMGYTNELIYVLPKEG